VLEIKAGNTIRDAIHMIYEKDTFGAVIVDVLDTETTDIRHSDRYIGFIAFPNIVLWCLEVYIFVTFVLYILMTDIAFSLAFCIFKEYENIREDATDNHLKDVENDGLFSILDRIPQIGQTKV
jgi:hypothetical protein